MSSFHVKWEILEKALNASKDTFFSIISHDLRSPFNLLLNFSALLEENVETYSREEIRFRVKKLRANAEQLYALLENLLTWSRIQRSAMEYQPETLALSEVFGDQLAFFDLKAEHKGIRLSAEFAAELRVYADGHMLDVVLRNLLSNAIKFTPQHGAVTLTAKTIADQLVEVAVSDTGAGIPADDLGKLFRIDVKYTNPGTAGERGAGLGLNLCKELVEKNGGMIIVKSDVGKGATFRFTLPRAANPS